MIIILLYFGRCFITELYLSEQETNSISLGLVGRECLPFPKRLIFSPLDGISHALQMYLESPCFLLFCGLWLSSTTPSLTYMRWPINNNDCHYNVRSVRSNQAVSREQAPKNELMMTISCAILVYKRFPCIPKKKRKKKGVG